MRIKARNSGFSLIELLTVIAIIAILAAIIFPVMKSVKDRANEGKCMTYLKSINSAIKMYKLDNRKYPERLGAIYESGKAFDYFASHPMPGSIMGDQIKSVGGFRCPSSRNNDYTAPVNVVDPWGNTLPFQYYLVDDYDAYLIPGGTGDPTAEQRYVLQWARDVNDVSRLTADGNSEQDDYERQLFRRNPPESTVVTWCSNHQSGEKDVVLFLDGMTRAMDSTKVKASKWRTKPPQL